MNRRIGWATAFQRWQRSEGFPAIPSARFHLSRPARMIEEGARKALKDLTAIEPYVPTTPTTITVELSTVDTAEPFMNRHGVEFVEPLKVESRAENWMAAWDQIWD